MVEDGFAGAVRAPALVGGDGGTAGSEDDATVGEAEGGEGGLDLRGGELVGVWIGHVIYVYGYIME